MYPRPENVGLTLDVDEGNLVVKVRRDSVADRVGLRPGDRLRRMGDSPIYSQADVSWALHNASEEGHLPLQYFRSGTTEVVTLPLAAHWKETKLSWRASMRGEATPPRRGK